MKLSMYAYKSEVVGIICLSFLVGFQLDFKLFHQIITSVVTFLLDMRLDLGSLPTSANGFSISTFGHAAVLHNHGNRQSRVARIVAIDM